MEGRRAFHPAGQKELFKNIHAARGAQLLCQLLNSNKLQDECGQLCVESAPRICTHSGCPLPWEKGSGSSGFAPAVASEVFLGECLRHKQQEKHSLKECMEEPEKHCVNTAVCTAAGVSRSSLSTQQVYHPSPSTTLQKGSLAWRKRASHQQPLQSAAFPSCDAEAVAQRDALFPLDFRKRRL